MRCTTFTKFPVAFSGGRTLATRSGAAADSFNVAVEILLQRVDVDDRRICPGWMLRSCVSLKFAVTQRSPICAI